MQDENGLCKLYKEAKSEDIWCYTCRTYPRHIEEYDTEREFSLCLSCPEVCRIVFDVKSPLKFIHTEDNTEETLDFDDFDYMTDSYLTDIRKDLISIVQDRSLSINDRTKRIRILAAKIQKAYDEGTLPEFSVDEALKSCDNTLNNDLDNTEQYFDLLKKTEPLFKKNVVKALALFDVFKKNVPQGIADFDNNHDISIPLEHILTYHLYSYFCGAVYDGYIFSRAMLGCMAVSVIKALCAASYIANGVFSSEVLQKITTGYSRELEHSDQNLSTALKELDAMFLSSV